MSGPSHKRFTPEELVLFLRAIDTCLEAEASMILIGGSAVAIGYEVDVGTQDIDTFQSDLVLIAHAARQAREVTGLKIPVSNAGVADVPWNYRDRLVPLLPELCKLSVFTLEKHDLALSKAIRGSEQDLQQLAELHRLQVLDFETLVHRFITEMDHVVRDPKLLLLSFVVLIEELYGESQGIEARRRIRAGA